jgi:hypothetical protein
MAMSLIIMISLLRVTFVGSIDVVPPSEHVLAMDLSRTPDVLGCEIPVGLSVIGGRHGSPCTKLDPAEGAQRGFLQSVNRNGVSPSRCAVVRRAGIIATDANEQHGGKNDNLDCLLPYLLYEVAKVLGRNMRRTSGGVAKSSNRAFSRGKSVGSVTPRAVCNASRGLFF